jgi:hypothetical protein
MALYSALLVILFVARNIRGRERGGVETTGGIRQFEVTVCFIEVVPLNVYLSTHILLAALILPK